MTVRTFWYFHVGWQRDVLHGFGTYYARRHLTIHSGSLPSFAPRAEGRSLLEGNSGTTYSRYVSAAEQWAGFIFFRFFLCYFIFMSII